MDAATPNQGAVPARPQPVPRTYEIDGRDRLLLAFALAFGVLLAHLFLCLMWVGLGGTLLVLAWEGVLLWYAGEGRGVRAALDTAPKRLLTQAVVVLAGTFSLFANRWFWFLNVFALACLMGVQMFELFGGASLSWGRPLMLVERCVLTLRGLFAFLPAPFQAVVGLGKESPKRKTLAYAGLGALLAAAVLMLVLPLLLSADALFDQLAGEAVRFLEEHFGSLATRLVLGLAAAPFLYGLLYALRRPGENQSAKLWAEAGKGLAVDPVLGVTVVAVLDGVYVLFVAVQSAALFGGEAYLQRAGISYAEYARSGFFQLVWVSAINLAVVVAAVHFARREGKGFQVLRVLSTALVALSGVMLVSAAWRMTLYVSTYGLSLKRLLTYWGMGMLAVFFAAALLKIWRKDFGFFRVLLAAGLAGWLLLNCLRPDAIVAHYNVWAYYRGDLETLDVAYLSRLSYAALGALEQLPGDTRVFNGAYDVEDLLRDRRASAAEEASHWESWTLSAALAAR